MLPIGATNATSSSDPSDDDDDLETYLLLLLSDSNLPTGGFVASSGLESFHAHGLLHNSRPTPELAEYGQSSSSTPRRKTGFATAPSQAQLSSATLSFAQSTLHSYARSSFGFLARVHAVTTAYLERCTDVPQEEEEERLKECLGAITKLDHSYHTLLLNHVARRASKAQGIALLTLYSKAFAKPINLDREAFNAFKSDNDATTARRIELAAKLVDRFKMDIRRSSTRSSGVGAETVHGHLPICWAVFAACLGISLKKAMYLHLFLQARSLFSSSIRLNTLGPYLAHQIMRFQMRGVVERVVREMVDGGCLDVDHLTKGGKEKLGEEMQVDQEPEAYTIDDQPPAPATPTAKFRNTATISSTASTTLRPPIQPLRVGKNRLIPVDDTDPKQGWAWDWPEEQDIGCSSDRFDTEKGFWTQPWAPATTFPLGEIVQARHDQLHSRLFNS